MNESIVREKLKELNIDTQGRKKDLKEKLAATGTGNYSMLINIKAFSL